MASAKTLAKELVHTRRMTTRLWTNKAHMMSMNSQLTEQLGMVKVAGTLKQSTQVHLVQILPNATRILMRVRQGSALQVRLNPGPALKMCRVFQSQALDLPCPQQFAAQPLSCKVSVTWCDTCFCRRHAEADTSQLIMLVCDRLC
jgi:hypothetical protein